MTTIPTAQPKAPDEMHPREIRAELVGHLAALRTLIDVPDRTALMIQVAAELVAAQHEVNVLLIGALDAVDQVLDTVQHTMAGLLEQQVHRNVSLLVEVAEAEARAGGILPHGVQLIDLAGGSSRGT